MPRRVSPLWYAVPLVIGGVMAVAWVRLTGGSSLLAALRMAHPGIVVAMLAITASWLLLRFLRWQFLLRRVGIRLPIRPSLATYLAALPGTATPAYIGEVARAIFLRRRFGTPVRPLIAVLVLERLADVAALAIITATVGGAPGLAQGGAFLAAAIIGALLFLTLPTGRALGAGGVQRLRSPQAVVVVVGTSIMAWSLAAALYALGARALDTSVGLTGGAAVFARSTLLGAITLAPAGIGATGSIAIVQLQSLGLSLATAVSVVTLVRLTSTGFAMAVGILFLWRELRGRPDRVDEGVAHFDTIAAEYNAQWSPHVWDLLLDRKLSLMADALPAPPAAAGIGIDLGCGLGLQTAEMRRRGFDVIGLEPSVGLLQQKRAGGAPVLAADALRLPLRDASVDFVFTIGVLHHLPGRDAQRQAVGEIARVLKPGGTLLVHESNPRNPLFRFYMGYLFPILKSIDEGTEWWIDPRAWNDADGLRSDGVRYFTFLPDFTPRFLMKPAMLLEGWLERGPTRDYSAHYLAILRRRVVEPVASVSPDVVAAGNG